MKLNQFCITLLVATLTILFTAAVPFEGPQGRGGHGDGDDFPRNPNCPYPNPPSDYQCTKWKYCMSNLRWCVNCLGYSCSDATDIPGSDIMD